MFVGGEGVGLFLGLDEPLLLRPALVHALEAPVETAPLANGPSVHDHEDGIAVRRGQDAQRHPTAARDLRVEGNVSLLPISEEVLPRHGHSVDDQFQRHLACPAEAGPLDLPDKAVSRRGVDFLIQQGCDLGGDVDGDVGFLPVPVHAQLTPALAHRHVVHLEVEQVAVAVAHVVASQPDAFAPVVVGQLAVELHVAAAQAHALAVDAGEICLTTRAHAEPGVQAVIPHVQLRLRIGIDGGGEINRRHQLAVRSRHLVRDVHDKLVRADAVVIWHLIARQFPIAHGDARAAVGRAGHGALLLGPAQRVQAEGGPVLVGNAAGINLILEPQQHEMAALMRAEAAYLDVVAEQIGILRNLVHRAAEKLLLKIKARTPRQVRPDLQVLAYALVDHVLSPHALGGLCVMRAARRVNVMVARPPPRLGRINPARRAEGQLARRALDALCGALRDGLGAARHLEVVGAGGQLDLPAVRAIDLRLKRKVRREAFGQRGINAILRIANEKGRRGRRAVFIPHPQRDLLGRARGEKHIHLVAETQVLRPLTHVEGKLRLPPPRVAAVKLDDAILQRQPAQGRSERGRVKHREVEPLVGNFRRRRVRHLLRVRADRVQRRGGAGVICHLHEENAPAALVQFRRRLAHRHLHAHLGIDADPEERVAVEHGLNERHALGRRESQRAVHLLHFRLAQGRTQMRQRDGEPRGLRVQRLEINIGHKGKRPGGPGHRRSED